MGLHDDERTDVALEHGTHRLRKGLIGSCDFGARTVAVSDLHGLLPGSRQGSPHAQGRRERAVGASALIRITLSALLRMRWGGPCGFMARNSMVPISVRPGESKC